MRKEPGKGRRWGSVAVGVLLLAIGVGYSSGSAKSAVAAHSGASGDLEKLEQQAAERIFELEDPVLQRKIAHGYDVVTLPIFG